MVPGINLPQQAVNTIYGGLAVIVALTLVACVLQWRDDWKVAHQTFPPAEKSIDKTIRLIAAIPQSHLFGKSTGGKIPISSLELRVTGIVKVEDERGNEVSKAYISQAGGVTKIYQTGDKIIEGVKVYSIKADTVILENDGELEKLPLPREPLQFKPRDDMEP